MFRLTANSFYDLYATVKDRQNGIRRLRWQVKNEMVESLVNPSARLIRVHWSAEQC